jgi:hypothetical protein
MSDQLELMVKYLIRLQFYSEEEDVIVSRDKREKIKIPGVGEVIEAFENEFLEHIDLIRKKQYRKFLEEVHKKIDFDIESILVDFNKSVEELGSNNLTDELSTNFLIGPIRTFLHIREFDECIYEIKHEAIIRKDTEDAKEIINERIADFFSRNEESVSMLHNLALLKYITFLYGSKETQFKVVRIYDQYCEQLAAKLSE